jgi:hypothetical protein
LSSFLEISLVSLSIHYHELKPHIEKLVGGTYIFLDRVYLLSGTWVVLLDVLLEKAGSNSVVSLPAGKQDGYLKPGLDANPVPMRMNDFRY